jgi:hypothetical protein
MPDPSTTQEKYEQMRDSRDYWLSMYQRADTDAERWQVRAEKAEADAAPAQSGEQSHDGLRIFVCRRRYARWTVVEGTAPDRLQRLREAGWEVVKVMPCDEHEIATAQADQALNETAACLDAERAALEVERLRMARLSTAVMRHREALDRRAAGDSSLTCRDRDDFDNDLYNTLYRLDAGEPDDSNSRLSNVAGEPEPAIDNPIDTQAHAPPDYDPNVEHTHEGDCILADAAPSPVGEREPALTDRDDDEQCTYCGGWFPKPVSLHHAEEDCVRAVEVEHDERPESRRIAFADVDLQLYRGGAVHLWDPDLSAYRHVGDLPLDYCASIAAMWSRPVDREARIERFGAIELESSGRLDGVLTPSEIGEIVDALAGVCHTSTDAGADAQDAHTGAGGAPSGPERFTKDELRQIGNAFSLLAGKMSVGSPLDFTNPEYLAAWRVIAEKAKRVDAQSEGADALVRRAIEKARRGPASVSGLHEDVTHIAKQREIAERDLRQARAEVERLKADLAEQVQQGCDLRAAKPLSTDLLRDPPDELRDLLERVAGDAVNDGEDVDEAIRIALADWLDAHQGEAAPTDMRLMVHRRKTAYNGWTSWQVLGDSVAALWMDTDPNYELVEMMPVERQISTENPPVEQHSPPSLPDEVPLGCHVDSLSSAVCSRGTKCCVLDHDESPPSPPAPCGRCGKPACQRVPGGLCANCHPAAVSEGPGSEDGGMDDSCTCAAAEGLCPIHDELMAGEGPDTNGGGDGQ